MKYAIIFAAALSVASARPTRHHLFRREVPQEHSHEQFLRTVNTNLKIDNPNNIQDAVFGLLGNAAASAGQGNIADTDCLQQATADRAFTNAKAAGDVDGMTAALVYRAIERNTGSVGLASVACTAIQAVNPEIAALTQHQDDNAAATNKNITLELAKQIASIGGDPQVALKSGTFKPGQVGDTTGAGNSCDDANDAEGCIFSQNLLVEDATAAEIDAAVAGVSAASSSPSSAASAAPAAADCAGDAAAAAADPNANANSNNSTAAAAAAASSSSSSSAVPAAAAAAAAADSTSSLDLGTATNPTVVFGAGFDGRKEDSFEPADKTEFTHGSAQNIKVVSDFICQQLGTKFQASQAAVDACNQGSAAAQAQTGQQAADTFNAALGF